MPGNILSRPAPWRCAYHCSVHSHCKLGVPPTSAQTAADSAAWSSYQAENCVPLLAFLSATYRRKSLLIQGLCAQPRDPKYQYPLKETPSLLVPKHAKGVSLLRNDACTRNRRKQHCTSCGTLLPSQCRGRDLAQKNPRERNRVFHLFTSPQLAEEQKMRVPGGTHRLAAFISWGPSASPFLGVRAPPRLRSAE